MAVDRTSHGYVAPVFSLRRRSVRNTGVFSCALPMNTTPFRLFELLSLFRSNVVLALSFAERNDRNFLPAGILLQLRHEASADRIHQSDWTQTDFCGGIERSPRRPV